MIRGTMQKAFWERTKNPMDTEWYSDLPKLRPGHPRYRIFLKNFAHKKMTLPYIISAEFHNVREVFEPWINLVIDEGDVMRFYGVYNTGLEIEEPLIRPSFCLRKGVWDGDLDFKNFVLAEDKLEYVTLHQALQMDISYTSLERAPVFYDLSRDGARLFQQGISLQSDDRSDAGIQNIALDYWDEDVHYFVSYSPLSKRNLELEKWIDQWITNFNSQDPGSEFDPDGPSRISYKESLTDWMKYFSDPEKKD